MALGITDYVNIRSVEIDDVNFILSSSSKCLLSYSKDIFRGWNPRDMMEHLKKIILFSLKKLDYNILVACNKDDSNQIFAYLMADSKHNHILLQYTKYPYRKLGLQNNLLMPLLLDRENTITTQFGTCEMEKLVKSGHIIVKNILLETLMGKI